jgi:hypothetical protein
MFTYEYAEPTDQMLLNDILDLDTGLPIDTRAFLTRDLAMVIQDRNEMAGRYTRSSDALVGLPALWRRRDVGAYQGASVTFSSPYR